ncbi:flagellar motor protein MotB [Magnetospira sp. QH-2]|uniref:flagellar motor protein MotB n=1 Tax=Magnetospira sp. (strain QH-2) TaxID=1288970 RepID=UPI0011DD64BC|nr:flagellar motor protein MotB [Magnetospira sp. QH-2]
MREQDDYDVMRVMAAKGGGQGSIALFLGLYLLVLAFFIILVSISTIEEVKSKAVMDSLTSTFATILPPDMDLTDLTSKTGYVIGAEEFQGEIEGVFTTHIKAVKVEIVQPGKSMRLSMDAEELFMPDEPVIRRAQGALLDRLVSSLSGRPQALRFDMDFLIGSKYTDGTSLPIGQTLSMRRAGELARAMLGRGVPPDSLSVGLKPGNPDQVVIWFYVRGRNEAQVRFNDEQVVRDAAAPTNQVEEGAP